MSGMALYGTCDAIVGERDTSTPTELRVERIYCHEPASHEVDDGGYLLQLCDEHTRQVLRDPGHATVRRLDQGGAG